MYTKDKITGYIGTYTDGESEGIYSFSLDLKNGKIGEVELAAKLDNPTYLHITKDNKNLYSVIKIDQAGGIAAFSIPNESKNLELLNYQVSEGKPPCHVNVDPEHHYVFSSNFHTQKVEVFPVKNDMSIGEASITLFHEGHGLHKDTQEKPHLHFAGVTPDEQYLYVVDLGSDQVITYDIKNNFEKKSSLAIKPGSGPRHLKFHANGKFAYLINELSSEVTVLKYNSQDGSFKEIQYISTLPKDFNGKNTCSAIHLSHDSRFVYAGNRGHDSIAVFSIHPETFELTLISHASTAGSGPRDFALDPTGTFIVASNQNTSNLVLFKINQTSGELTKIQDDISVPNPVCVKFSHI
ncbi:lactonase family protein [Bacillus sp. RG28]|uniref:Lactonase family protein n=1 Tax=Gottfriedia endophytica TaxID=2820819 RepID=A0A940NX52_9BACI|nr:lactonase family protein [Gottfriedia endophytica]MBP0726613.1 lactonase family protein [Gottfriedia endophytica]